jgi:prophage antirepressor-like protein
MSADIIPFRYAEARELRTVVIDGEPWFVAADVAVILDMSNVHSSLALLDDDERGVHTVETPSAPQSMAVVSEAGLYSLILRSRKAEAKPFKRWVTHEVIPSIRKTGSYGVQHALPKDYASALRELAAQVEATELAKVRIRELEPAASAWASLVEATGDYSVADAAKMLSRDPAIGIGQNTLFRWMGKHGWLYQRNGEWHPYQDKVDAALLTSKANRPYWNSRLGVDVLPAPTVRITAKGLQRLYRLLGGAEALAEVAS